MKYFLYICLGLALISCSREDLSDIKDIIYVRNAGADMPAYIHGNGASGIFIILLHGGPGGNGLQYRSGSWSDDLESRYAMVYLDQRGQGMAQGHFDDSDVTVEQMAEDVADLARIVKHKYGSESKVFLMGHSWGGTLGSTVMVTEDYQFLFDGWIEIDGAHDLPQTYRGAIRQFQRIAPEQISLTNNVDFWQSSLDQVNDLDTSIVDFSYINKRAFEAESKLQDANVINESDETDAIRSLSNMILKNNLFTTTLAGLQTANQLTDNGLQMYSVTNQLSNIEIPTLLLWGRFDLVVAPELGETAFERISSSDKELFIFEASGHSPMITQPDIFVEVVSRFIDRQ